MKKNKKDNGVPSTRSILAKALLRTFTKSPMQFIAVIFITALAMTLFVGLTSNATWIEARVQNLYQGSNMADIWTSVTLENEGDYESINEIIGNDGVTEERFTVTGTINGHSATAIMSKELPTINKPYTTTNTATDNFMIFDERLLETSAPTPNGKWTDDNGNYYPVQVGISFSMYREALNNARLSDVVKNMVGEETYTFIANFLPEDMLNAIENESVMNVLNLCVTDGGTNVFDSAYLSASFDVSGLMTCAENVQSSNISDSAFYLDSDYFSSTLKQIALNNFVVPTDTSQYEGTDRILVELFNLIKSFLPDFNLIEEFSGFILSYFNVNQYVTKLNDSSRTAFFQDKINTYFAAKPASNLLMIQTQDNLMSNLVIQNDINQARQFAYIFPMIFFLVAILVVLTTLSQIILKDRTTIGTMKAIGMTYGTIMRHYITLSLLIVFVGVAIGLILGPFVLPTIMGVKYSILYTLPAMGYMLSWPEALGASGLILGISAVVAFFIIRKEAILKPTQSMRPAAPKSVKKASAASMKQRSAFRMTTNMAFRNIRVNIPKSIMVIIGVMGCTALLVVGFGIDDTIDYGVKHDIDAYYNSDITLAYSSTSSKAEELDKIEGISHYEEYSSLPSVITFEDISYSSYVFAFPDNCSYVHFDDRSYELKEDIVMSQKVSDALHLRVGDTVSFTVIGTTYTGKIGYITSSFYLNGLYLNVDQEAYKSIATYKTSAWLDLAEGADYEVVKEQLMSINGVNNVSSYDETETRIGTYVTSVSSMTLAIKVFAILLAIIVLYNLALLNFRERMRDIATLKVLGFTRMEIGNSFGIETLFLTAIGIAFGLAVGFPLERLILYVNSTPLVDFLYFIYPQSFIYALLITFLTAFAVTTYLIIKTRKIKMVESLKSVE